MMAVRPQDRIRTARLISGFKGEFPLRQNPRVAVNVPVTLSNSGHTWRGWAKNLSLGGAFITLAANLEAHQLVNLRFALSPPFSPLEALGRVMRREPQGIAVEFLDLDVHSRSVLFDFLTLYWPTEISACPFCGQAVSSRGRKRCPFCRQFLDWRLYGAVKTREPEEMIGACPAMREVFTLIRQAAASDVPVLLTGPGGSGKELAARAIHQRSHRALGPFVEVNCGTIPLEYLEVELFGQQRRRAPDACGFPLGHLKRALGGTLFLDAVGQLPLDLQEKLLAFLKDFTLMSEGRGPLRVNLRIIAASEFDLDSLITSGLFLKELYHSLGVLRIHLPPLRDRGDDALIMAHVFLKRYAAKLGKNLKGFTPEAAAAIQAHSWPGNVRELINRIRRAVVLAEENRIAPEHLGLEEEGLRFEPHYKGKSLREARAAFEAYLVRETLRLYQGNVHLASKALRVSRSTMYHFIQKYRLKPYITMAVH
uniref:Sigma-54 factor interaction domain-containing protein n=1 Tax=Desulfobacca acetoxidans TaxID=60893 RepID=A0A7C5AKZ7_9BACT